MNSPDKPARFALPAKEAGRLLLAVLALSLPLCAQGAEHSELTLACPVSDVRILAQCPGGSCPGYFCPPAPRVIDLLPSAPSSSLRSSPSLSAATFDTVVKIRGDNQLGGSGVLVDCDGQAVILTAEHVVRGARQATITFRDGQQRTSREILVDRGRLDLAAVLIDWPQQIQPAAVGDMPHEADVVVACGYGSDDRLAGLPNTIRGLRFSQLGGAGAEPDSLEMLGTFRSGDSGGPVFNDRQQVVAIINASSAPGAANQSNVAICCRPIRALLERLRDRLGKGRNRSLPSGGAKDGPPASELAPGIAIPKVELPASDGCKCDSAAVLKKLDELRQDIGGRAAQPGSGNSQLRDKLDELAVRLAKAATRDDVTVVAQGQSSVQSELGKLKSAMLDRAPAVGMTLGKLVAGALGLSTPVGLGLGIAGWLIGRRLRRKGGAQTSDLQPQVSSAPSGAQRTVILETPPPPQVVERSQQFVPYQAHSARLDAIERAMAEYVRKYPSAAGIFETINVYANQFQSGDGS